LKNKVKMMMVGTTAVGALLAMSPAANADPIPNVTINYSVPSPDMQQANLGTPLVSVTPIGGTGDSVTGTCTGTPAGGSFNTTNFVVTATASASSTVGDVGLATGVTCRVWDLAHGVWLSPPVSGSDPGPDAVAAGEVTVDTSLTDPIGCVYANALFGPSNTPASSRGGTGCPSHP